MRNTILKSLIFLMANSLLQPYVEAENTTQTLNQPTVDFLLKQADELFEAKLYTQAIPLYQKILLDETTLGAFSDDFKALVTYQLAQSLFLSEDYAGTINIINKSPEKSSGINLLLAIALRKFGAHEQSVHLLQQHITENKTALKEAHLELALALFEWNQYENARHHFEIVLTKNGSHRLQNLAHFYLARLDLLQKAYPEALQRLLSLQQQLDKDDFLQFELQYLLGDIYLALNEYAGARDAFLRSIPANGAERLKWYPQALQGLGWSYTKLGENPLADEKKRISFFEQAEDSFQRWIQYKKEENAVLALGQCYLSRAKCLEDPTFYQKAESLLSQAGLFISEDAKARALLMRSEAASSYVARDALYRYLTHPDLSSSSYYAEGWYLRGVNDLEQARLLSVTGGQEEAEKIFAQASIAFEQAFQQLKKDDPDRALLAMKQCIQIACDQNTTPQLQQAMHLLKTCLNEHSDLLKRTHHTTEMSYLYALTAARLWKMTQAESWYEEAKQALQPLMMQQEEAFAENALNLWGTLLFQHEHFAEAQTQFAKVAEKFPNSDVAGDALFWAARSAEALDDFQKGKEFRTAVWENYPHSAFAAEAFFTYYTLHDYLQGERTAVKHLHSFLEKYPHSPFAIPAWFLVGLDCKRDRKTAEGKWIRKKNLTEAIEAFQEAISVYDALYQKGLLPEINQVYYTAIRFKALFENALTNLTVADEAQGAKREIYLEYAKLGLQQLLVELPLSTPQTETSKRMQDEAAFWLAQTLAKEGNDAEAELAFNDLLEKCQSAKITRGYLLSRILCEKGMLAIRAQSFPVALENFALAEDAAKGKVLSADQKLDLWIQQSNCHRALQNYDQAILILSKAINDDSISNLRIKAMYARAEVYELQGRYELARRQLEAASKKGGEWSLKAKEKLDNEYGNPKRTHESMDARFSEQL
ncbi:MAG: tetratricopeptide repeat protein [Parachlamydiaceae bacterium]|nr:tetratricopeptide repeat protein [Parachlamydiaceae bacterium]